MSGLTIPSTGTLSGLTVNYTPTKDLSGQSYNSGNLYNQPYSNIFGPPQAYADTTNTFNYTPGQNTPGLTINSTPQTSNVPQQSKAQAWAASGGQGDVPVGWNPTQTQTDAAQAAYNAENGRLNTQYDQAAANLNAQLPYLQQQRDSALSSLNLANDTATKQANDARLSAQTNTQDQINQAGDVAHQTQNQNRNILRALGIGGGTYAAELLSKPLNTYDQQRGQLGQALTQRMGQLDDYLNTVTQQHAQAVSDLQNNYANLVGKIQSDLRFNDRQRNDALQAANAALQTNLANIQSSAQQYAQQVALMKQQLAQSAGTVTNYTNPTYDPNQFSADLLSNTNSGNQFSTGNLQALTNPQKKNQLTLNDLAQGVQNGGLTLSGLGQ